MRLHHFALEDVEKAILNVTRSQMLILGKEVETLENTLADYCGVKYAIGVSNTANRFTTEWSTGYHF